jgi:2-polyprenyl-6-methoxyphenol hydroxylase-like FAD-dependent oxidoreductase
MDKRVLICGASVAGPALAYWLGRSGYEVTVVERAAQLREGGHAVDFRGSAHFKLLERMGVLDELRELQTHAGAMRFIDWRERTKLSLPREFAGGDLEVRRADLARVLYERSRANAEYIFGDCIETFARDGNGVDVTFRHAPPRRFDLVIGADGIHSGTRRLLFGESFETYLGYRVAGWDAPRLPISGDEAVLLNAPGRMIGLTPGGRNGGAPRVFCIFASPKMDNSRGATAHKPRLREIFGDLGWRVPEILESLDQADDVFVSSISRAEPPYWSAGRVALVGDAASGVAIGGMGTGMAMIGAYVLAGELSLDPANPSEAFARYQQRLEAHVRSVTRSASPGPFLAPRTALGLWLRNTLFSVPACQRWLIRESGRRTEVDIPDYPNLPPLAAPTQRRVTAVVK